MPRLSKRHFAQRLENVCTLVLRALAPPRYSLIRPILESEQDVTDEIPDIAGGISGGVDDAGWVCGGDYYANVGR